MLRSLLLVSMLSLLAVAVHWAWRALDAPIRTVAVHGAERPSEAREVREQIARSIGQGILSTRLDALRDSILDLSWTDNVRIYRAWPDTLRVELERKRLIGRWADGRYVSEAGRLINAPAEIPGVIEFDCVFATPQIALATWRYLQAMAETQGLTISSLHENGLGEWRLGTEDGIEASLGNQDLQRRMARFLTLHEHLSERTDKTLAYVDLRYVNGAAVRWADQAMLAGLR